MSVEANMSAGAAAAAAARRRREQEEEEMTMMNTDPSGAVEYKIIRSATGAFKDPAKFRAALDEEARAGWELVEKLDNSRARLRRSTECRKRDAELGQDPYRTQVGMREGVLALCIVVAVLTVVALLLGAVAGIVSLNR
jgi:hypothetical protein